jgi:hypothetical protein
MSGLYVAMRWEPQEASMSNFTDFLAELRRLKGRLEDEIKSFQADGLNTSSLAAFVTDLDDLLTRYPGR